MVKIVLLLQTFSEGLGEQVPFGFGKFWNSVRVVREQESAGARENRKTVNEGHHALAKARCLRIHTGTALHA